MLLPPPAEAIPVALPAERLRAFARGLGVPVGIERSCKFAPGRIHADRFLLSFAADRRVRARMMALLAEQGFPKDLVEAFTADAEAAAFLHLGYEEASSGAVLKAYCEAEPGEGALARVHVAYKWSPGGTGTGVIDDYWLRRDLEGPGMAAAMGEAFGPDDAGLTGACVDLLEQARGRLAEDEVFFLDVRRRGAARASFDLRLYGGGLTVGDAQSLITRAAALAGAGQGAPTMDAGRTLGHISGGRDDAGQPFVTVYFGAEDFA
jgi:hypothetical protein